MTVKLSATSSRTIDAARFGAELAKAMRARRVSNQRLAEAARSTKSAIANWKVGGNLPRTATAVRLAEALDWPKLVDIARAGRSGPCGRCGRIITNEGGSPKRFCSVSCRDVDEQLRKPGAGATLAAVVRAELERISGTTHAASRRTLRSALAAYNDSERRRIQRIDKQGRQLAGIQSAVDAMCAGCEPTGVCNDDGCALRPVSPLPMASAVSAGVIREAEGPWHPNRRDRQLTAIRAGNAVRWSRPGERERQAEQSRAMFAAMTPEQRAEHRRSIAEGRTRSLLEKERAS